MRLARFSLIAALGVVVLIGGLVFAGLRALDSAAGRARIAAMLSDKLGQPVAIGGIAVSLLPKPSLAASDISVGGSDSAAAPGVALAGLRVVPRVSSLLPGRTLVLEHIELEGLRVSLRRDSTGRWLLPGAAAAPAAAASPAPEGPALEVEALRVRNGVIRVVDDSLRTNGKPTITAITDVEADLDAIRGTLNVRRFAGRLGTTAVAGSAELGSHGANLRLTSESLQNADLPALFALAGMR
ncbi:MAG TPA: AsmA family protein, partial [Gemmatimonadales bacterium]|nr:AsmA family protein [Gemmatimonadales bacterium]